MLLLVSPCIFVLTGAFVIYSLGRPLVSPPCTKGDAHRRSDSKTCEQVFTRAPSYGSGRAPSFGSPCQVPSLVGYGGHPGGQDAGSTFFVLFLVRTYSSSRGGLNSLVIDTNHWGGSTRLSLDINTTCWGSSSSDSTSSHQVSFHSHVPDASLAFPTHSLD